MSKSFRGALLSMMFVGVLASCSESPTQALLDDALAASMSEIESLNSLSASNLPAAIIASVTSLHAAFDAAVESGAMEDHVIGALSNQLDQIGKALQAKSTRSGKSKKSKKSDKSNKSNKSMKSGKTNKKSGLERALEKAADKLEKFLKKLDNEAGKGHVEASAADALRYEVALVRAALTGQIAPDVGGTVVAAGGAVELVVPAGAVDEVIQITADGIPAPEDDTKVVPGTTYDFGPDGTEFNVPVAVTLAYDPSLVPDNLPDDAVFIAKNVGGEWQRVPGPVTVDVTAGTVTGELTSFSEYGVKADPCVLREWSLVTASDVSADDCLYQATRYEDIYRVVTADLVLESGQAISGAPKLTLTTTTDFDGVLGFQEADPALFEGLVHRFRNNLSAADPVSFSMIAGQPEYKVFIGGLGLSDFGDYSITTEVAPGGDFACGEVLVMAGFTDFSSSIDAGSSCEGKIEFGPNVGDPLLYQARYARLEAGEKYTISVTGLGPSAQSLALFVTGLPFSSGVDQQLDLGGSPTDDDRSISFTATNNGFYYIEVSLGDVSASASYDFSFGPHDPCALQPMALEQTGTVSADDCLYDGSLYEDLYRVVTADLVQQSGQSITGSPMLTLTAETSFNGVMGFQKAVPGLGQGVVYRYRNSLSPAGPVSFSMIAGDPEFKVFLGGLDLTQFGNYTLTTAVSAGGDFSCGDFPVIAGSAEFPSQISDANSCAGTVQFGEFIGQPLIYQGRGAKLVAGRSYTATISGLGAGDDAVALFVAKLPLSSGVDQHLVLTGGSQRSVTFTASGSGFYYVEVSNAPGVTTNYTLTFTEN